MHIADTYHIPYQTHTTHTHTEFQRNMSFQSKIKAALTHALHHDPHAALGFIENFKAFKDDLETTEDWEKELAIREVYKGRVPFVWSPWDDDIADPVASPEYEQHYEWCQDIEDLCLFIQNIENYI